MVEPLLLLGLAGGIGALGWLLEGSGKEPAKQTRGLSLLKARRLNDELHGWHRKRGIKLGNITVPTAYETEHIAITGQPGSGKTSLIRSLCEQIQKRGELAVVIDPECDLVQQFYDEKRGDLILNPLDLRSPFWTPQLEFRQDTNLDVDIDALVSSLLRGRTNDDWHGSARMLLAAALRINRESDNPQVIPDFLRLPYPEIVRRLQGTKAQALCDPRAPKQMSAIVNIAMRAAAPFDYLSKREQTKRIWSAREWAADPKGWLFMVAKEDARAALHQLQGVWFDSIIRWLLSRPIGPTKVWLIADELATLGYQPQLTPALTRLRKYGVRVVIGFQNISQLRSIYGHDGAISLIGAPRTKVILLTEEPETTEWLSKLIGGREDEGKVSRLVLPSQIASLKPLSGYVAIGGQNRAPITIKRCFLDSKQPDFLPRFPAPLEPEVLPPIKSLPKSRTPEYSHYMNIKTRCENKNNDDYPRYGGRGIRLLLTFDDMFAPPPKGIGPRPPGKGWSVGRLDNDGPYGIDPKTGKLNIRWEQPEEQRNNRSDSEGAPA